MSWLSHRSMPRCWPSTGQTPIEFEPGGPPSVLLTESGQPRMAGSALEPMGTISEQVVTAGLPNGLRKQVFGFLPYWMLTDAALADLNYHLVSTIAYFSVGAGKRGYLIKGTSSNPSTGWAGWTSAEMTQVIDRAHASGVKVVLTVTMMAWNAASADRQAALLGSSTARSRLVKQIVSAIELRGADGVNLDFEPLATSLRDEYVSFVRQLKRGLQDAGVGANLTVCVMAGAATWATGYDVAGLTASGAADALFVMGYDYHWSGSSRAGGVAPIQSPYTLDVAGTMADFLTETIGLQADLGRAVLRPHLADHQQPAERDHAGRRIEGLQLHRPPGAGGAVRPTLGRCRQGALVSPLGQRGRQLGAGLLRRRGGHWA